jgi:hypothetical protein
MINKYKALFIRTKDIHQMEGFIPLLKRIFGYFLFQYKTFYLYEHELEELEESSFLPRLENYSVQIVTDNMQADKLVTKGFDFRSHFPKARKGLDKGAIAFCIFKDNELASIGWLAMNEQARKFVDPLPYHVNYAAGEVGSGGSKTIPKYRGQGLLTYNYFLRLKYLYEHNVRIMRSAVEKNNLPSHMMHKKFKEKIPAKARYVKILCWQSWKETPLT